jgi:hypothetical protein
MSALAFKCYGCGASCLMPADFKPVHFTGRLAHLSRGYCTVNCARVELNRLILERTREWNYIRELGELA